MILMGFKYLASSIPLISLGGVAIGVGLISPLSIAGVSRNPSLSDSLIRYGLFPVFLVLIYSVHSSYYSIVLSALISRLFIIS